MKIIDHIKILTGKKKATEHADLPAKKKVLIVEDEKPLLAILSTKLTEEGFEVLQAENGEDGLKLALENQPDIILLDLMMPVMDGKAMLRKLRELPEGRKIPVVVLTDAGEIENVKETQVYGHALEFIVKSNVSMEQIVERVKVHTLGTMLT